MEDEVEDESDEEGEQVEEKEEEEERLNDCSNSFYYNKPNIRLARDETHDNRW